MRNAILGNDLKLYSNMGCLTGRFCQSYLIQQNIISMMLVFLTPTTEYFKLLQLPTEAFLHVKYAKANYTLVRVFCVCLVQKPIKDHWSRGLDAMEDALTLEKDVYQSLLDLHAVGAQAEDPQV